VDTHGMKKIGRYPHNGYLTDISRSTGRIFFQQVGYGGATTRTLPAPLTSADKGLESVLVIVLSHAYYACIDDFEVSY